jgi:quercetin dioxygenase-like cupin family protein
MTNYITTIETERIRKWYEQNLNPNFFNQLVEEYTTQGYVLDTKSGLLKKPLFDEETTRNLGSTTISIVYPKPSSLHYHQDVGKALSIIKGRGKYYEEENEEEKKIITISSLKPGKSIWTPKSRVHAFRPDKGGFLEMLIAFDGIFDKKQEVSIQPFNEFWK